MESMIPLFACKSLETTLSFYQALGFEVTFQQDEPYVYAAVSRGAINLHFAKRAAKSTCLVFIADSAAYHRVFSDALRTHYGMIPTADFPRISRFRQGQTRFHLFDPSGNLLLFVNQDEPDPDYSSYDQKLSPLAQTLENAFFLRDTYVDDRAAAKVLDRALARHHDADPVDLARALAARAELALALGDVDTAQAVRNELSQMTLSDETREHFRHELQAADDLERWRVTQDSGND
jgi:catechol 2,3-dioxygenase-like lactoylglutathione lyase family enzyme